jgi:NAD(P)H-dependent FMN reductase
MKLAVFNGSPRAGGSNTKILLDHFLRGFSETQGDEYELFYLIREKDFTSCIEAFKKAEHVVLAFPLYGDSMPAPVKAFIEALEPVCGREGNPPLGFIVQSGFPESGQSHYLRRYLEKLTRRLGCRYTGTVIKGGVEGIQAQPPWMTRKLFQSFYELGRIYGQTGEFDPELVEKLGKPVWYSGPGLIVAGFFMKLFGHAYWNSMLKKNGAYEKRFARPYAPEK